jgi:DNA-binding response OmpR family regulator
VQKPTILVVDDESINIEIVSEILSEDYNIKIAKNGKTGYDIYKKYKPEIIVSDINMPVMDGIEMASKIREEDFNTKIIFITSHTDLEYLLKASTLKLTRYILKPIEKEELINSINNALNEIKNYKIISNNLLQIDRNYLWNFETLELIKLGETVTLTPKERKILNYMFSHLGKVITYDDILYEVWDDYELPTKQTLKTMITNLRKKTPNDLIHNIYGIGYKILTTS